MLSGFGAEPQPNKRIVKFGKIVTAAGVSAGIDLGVLLLENFVAKNAPRLYSS